MSKNMIIILLTILATVLIGIGGYYIYNSKSVEKVEYGKVLEKFELKAEFKEKDDKQYFELEYINKNTKPVIVRKIKLKIRNLNSKNIVYEKELIVNADTKPEKSTIVRFEKLDKEFTDQSKYSSEVTIE